MFYTVLPLFQGRLDGSCPFFAAVGSGRSLLSAQRAI
jgi:hypothetical protein